MAGLASLCSAFGQNPTDVAKRQSIAIEQVAVIDVLHGAVVEGQTVLIVDGQIAAMGKPETVTVPPDGIRVDGRGRYLMPGLVDMHVHLFNNASKRPPNEWAFPLFVANGVTGVREMRTEAPGIATVAGWRTKASRREIIAPRVLAAGVPGTGGMQTDAADTAAATAGWIRGQVREAKAVGADFIKIFSEVREREWHTILDQARAAGLPVCGHIPAEITLLDAANAGQRSNEHLTQVYEACSPREKEWLDTRRKAPDGDLTKVRESQEGEVLNDFDQAVCDRTAAALARTEQVQVPTLTLPFFESRGVPKNIRDDPHWVYLPGSERARWDRIFKEGYPVAGDKLAARRWEVSRQIVKTLHSAGVRILAGSDAPMPQVYPGFALHKELELLVESGLRPADALRAATIWPAEFLGHSEFSGSVTKSKHADLVLLDENPLLDIRHTQRVRAVVLDGRLLQRSDIDRLLEMAREGGGRQ